MMPFSPILQTVVLAAHMQLPEGILGNARCLQDNLIQLRVGAARLDIDIGGGDFVGRSAQLGLDAGTGGRQPLGRDRHGLDLLRMRRGSGGENGGARQQERP